MANRARILDYSEARKGDFGMSESEAGSKVVGGTDHVVSSRPSVKKSARPSVSKGRKSSPEAHERAARERERALAESFEETPVKRDRAKTPAQKRAEALAGRAARPSGSGQARNAAFQAQQERQSAQPQPQKKKQQGQDGDSSNSKGKSQTQGPKVEGGLAASITGGLVAAATAVVEFIRKPHSKGFKRAVIVISCLVIATLFIFPSVGDYYCAIRDNDKAKAEYAALEDYHAKLKDEVEYMNSEEGIKDLARDEYGMIQGGEVSLNVKNLDPEADFTSDPTEVGITPAGSIEAPKKWYTPFLDKVFGYKG